MVLVVVSVFDVAAGAYGRPAFVQSKGAALRSFQDEANREHADNVMFHHPADFQLFLLGSFDDLSGCFDLLKSPERIASGSDVKSV